MACEVWQRARGERRIDRIEATLSDRRDAFLVAQGALSLRVERLGPLLSSWETVGGCGAGSSSGAGSGVKWIGRSTRGGLFQSQLMATYLRLPKEYTFAGGYNLSVAAQVTRDLGEKWNVGVAVPYLYKYYRDYYELPVDISNAGLGDVNLLVTRRFGAINDTIVTATLGFPTGVHDARYKNDLLTQDKQLGHGRFTGSLMLDHAFDELWGLIVLGGLLNYRGGTNELGSYRSPMGSLYAHAGYFAGPFVPAIGLTFNRFVQADEDRTLEQDSPLTTLAPSASVEWSSDYVAVLAGASIPFVLTSFSSEPWVLAVGISVSPF